jgi:hypothetical protein|tara:strand:- start:41 stop:670 length:630 start_codon:yes stop_codon:yes gene_type:complete
MSHSIAEIKKSLNGGGARPNLFEVTFPQNNVFTFEGGSDSQLDSTVLVKAAQLPASNVASIDVPFRGRIMKVAGDRTFDTWTVTVINDVDFNLRTTFQNWMQKIAQYADASGEANPTDYKSTAVVKQLGRLASDTGTTAKAGLERVYEYTFFGIFPTNISAIDLSYDTADTIEEFTVEFQVDYWAPTFNKGGTAVTDNVDTTSQVQGTD